MIFKSFFDICQIACIFSIFWCACITQVTIHYKSDKLFCTELLYNVVEYVWSPNALPTLQILHLLSIELIYIPMRESLHRLKMHSPIERLHASFSACLILWNTLQRCTSSEGSWRISIFSFYQWFLCAQKLKAFMGQSLSNFFERLNFACVAFCFHLLNKHITHTTPYIHSNRFYLFASTICFSFTIRNFTLGSSPKDPDLSPPSATLYILWIRLIINWYWSQQHTAVLIIILNHVGAIYACALFQRHMPMLLFFQRNRARSVYECVLSYCLISGVIFVHQSAFPLLGPCVLNL